MQVSEVVVVVVVVVVVIDSLEEARRAVVSRLSITGSVGRSPWELVGGLRCGGGVSKRERQYTAEREGERVVPTRR